MMVGADKMVVGGTKAEVLQEKTRKGFGESVCKVALRTQCGAGMLWTRLSQKLSDTKGQGTTEYAILVGVLVVIAIIAVVAFRSKLQDLWTSISSGINSL